MPWIIGKLCTGCEKCVDACIVGAIAMRDEKAVLDTIRCHRCGACLEICPAGALLPGRPAIACSWDCSKLQGHVEKT